jgi:hypothetical protein
LLFVVCLPIAQSLLFSPSLWPVSLPRHRLASYLGRRRWRGPARWRGPGKKKPQR